MASPLPSLLPSSPSVLPSANQHRLALELRIRLLESLLTPLALSPSAQPSLGYRLDALQADLRSILNAKPNDAIRRFVDSYDLNEPLLRLPSPVPSHQGGPSHAIEPASLKDKLSLVFEAEAEIVQLDKDLRELQVLDGRGFAGAGRLADGDDSIEELDSSVIQPLKIICQTVPELEASAASLMSRYDAYVDALSEIFISWDAILTAVEDQVHELKQAHSP